jgi:hypothetical protein
MYRVVLTNAIMTEYVHDTYKGMVIHCTYSVRTSMSEYIQGVRIPDVPGHAKSLSRIENVIRNQYRTNALCQNPGL